MRGKRKNGLNEIECAGLIPAHAGKTRRMDARLYERGAHPRACGENVSSPLKMGNCMGSSPRMRGKRRKHDNRRVPRWLIPAHAGKTEVEGQGEDYAGAHPRACGENNSDPQITHSRVGSSPRMRGKQRCEALCNCFGGLIPAHAGKTFPGQIVNSHAWAHPRACGENTGRRPKHQGMQGSSPRMRGKRKRRR